MRQYKPVIFFLLLSTVLFEETASSQSSSETQIPYEARRDTVLKFFSEQITANDYTVAAARMSTEEHRAAGISMFEELTQRPSAQIVQRFRLTAAWLFNKQVLPDSLRNRIALIWKVFPVLPHRSEYERVLYYTSLLTTALHSGGEHWFNGRSSRENIDDARAYLTNWMDATVREGQIDFDSPTYGPLFIVSMLLLRDFDTDETMRKRAALMAQWLLADYAHDYLAGLHVGAHARELGASARQPMTSEFSAMAWLYFGDGHRIYARDQLYAALSDFRPHPAVVELATDRRKPFEAWEIKRSARRVRGSNESIHPVSKYTYMNPLYAVGSVDGGVFSTTEQHSWDISWPGSPNKSTLFTMHPFVSPTLLSEFHPHTPTLVAQNIAAIDQYYGTVTKSVGGSPYESILQYKNTIIALYDIPEGTRFDWLVGFLPFDTQSMEIDSLKSGWITINTGDVYLALYPFGKYEINKAQMGGTTVGNWLLSHERKNGIIAQAIGRNVIGPYEGFRRQIRATAVDLSTFIAEGRISYTTMFGDTLSITLDGDKLINGKAPVRHDNMLFQSPRLTSRKGTGIMHIHGRDSVTTIDMNTLTIIGMDR